MAAPGGVFSTTEREAASPSPNTGGASSSAMVTVATRRPTETWRDDSSATAGSPRMTWKLSGSSCSSSSRMVISMVASVCPAVKVTVPELGSCSCSTCAAGAPPACDVDVEPVLELLSHGTWIVPPAGAVSWTASATLRPSVTGPSGSWMETRMAPSSSVMVPVAGPPTVTSGPASDTVRLTVNVSFGSTSVSSVVATVKLCVSPAVPAKVSAEVFSV